MNQDSNAPQTAPDRQLEKRQTLWLLLAMFFVAGWFGGIIPEKSSYFQLYQLIVSLGCTLFVVRWVALDAVQRRFQLNSAWIFAFVLFSFLPLPVYLFLTRGKAVWRPILLGCGLLIIYSLTLGIGQIIARALLHKIP